MHYHGLRYAVCVEATVLMFGTDLRNRSKSEACSSELGLLPSNAVSSTMRTVAAVSRRLDLFQMLGLGSKHRHYQSGGNQCQVDPVIARRVRMQTSRPKRPEISYKPRIIQYIYTCIQKYNMYAHVCIHVYIHTHAYAGV